MQFFVEPIWSWPLTVLTSIGLFAIVLTTYRTQLRPLPRGTARLLLGLRLLSVIVLTFAMFRPSLQKSDTDDTPIQLQILSDVSRSMNTADMPGNVTRFKAIRSELAKYESAWKELGKTVEVIQHDFARDLMAYDASLTEGNGDQTAFGKVFDDLLREARDHRSLGVILLTDGAQRALPPFDIEPLAAARRLGDAQMPIYAVGYGNSSLSSASLDLLVEDLRVDPIVFEKKQVPLSVKLRTQGANGKKVRVRVMLEDRAGRRVNESGTMKPAPATQQARTVREFEIKQDSETIPVDLSFVPFVPGEMKIAVEVEPVENEFLVRNNRRESIVTVKRGGLNVAYFDSLRVEPKYIRPVSGAEKIQLDLYVVRQGKQAGQSNVDPAWFQRGRYDVYIIGDVRAEWFGEANLSLLAKRLDDGAGLMMIGGLQNFATGGYAKSPIEEWIPVVLNPADFRPEGDLHRNMATQLQGDVKLVPTADGLRSYVMQLGAGEKNRSLWMELPALNGANRLKPQHDLVRIWAETPDGQPLLMTYQRGNSRVAAFAADTTYLWYLRGKAEIHQRFWRQMIMWLAKKEDDIDQPVWVKVEPRNYAPGATAAVTFGARSADGSPLKDVEFDVEVFKPDGKSAKLTPRQTGEFFTAEFAETTDAGDYWVQVLVKRNGKLLPDTGHTRFIVDARDLELDYPSADYDFLKDISLQSGGTSIKPEEIGSLLERLKQTKFNAMTRIQVFTLYDNWWLLCVFVFLMNLEWFIRKKRGLV